MKQGRRPIQQGGKLPLRSSAKPVRSPSGCERRGPVCESRIVEQGTLGESALSHRFMAPMWLSRKIAVLPSIRQRSEDKLNALKTYGASNADGFSVISVSMFTAFSHSCFMKAESNHRFHILLYSSTVGVSA
jgi:hypothetical protein